MRRSLPPALIVLLAVQTLAPLADAGGGATDVVISEVLPWPDGNASAEFVELHVPEATRGVADLRGWTLTDNDGPPELVLGRVTMEPGAYLVIWNCKRPPGEKGLSCRRGAPTWNNDGDDIVLLDAGGRCRARLAYGPGPAVDPPPAGWPDVPHPAPGRGSSLSLDPATGEYVIANPSPGRATPIQAVVPQRRMEMVASAQGAGGPPQGESRYSDPGPTPGSGPSSGLGGDGPQPLIHAVHPGGGPGWEAVVLENRGDVPVDIGGLTISDGEGSWTLPAGSAIPPRSRVNVASNASAHEVLWGRPPDVVATVDGPFALADGGDDLTLIDRGGELIDSLWYGATSSGPPGGWSGPPVPCPAKMPWGRLLLRGPGPDTGTAADWAALEQPMCGWLEPSGPETWGNATAACFITPDEGLSAMSAAISSAGESICGAVYRLTSAEVASALAARARAGVQVDLLIEGHPAGVPASEVARRDGLLAALVDAGVHVHMTFSTEQGERLQPYLFHHAKYLVLDGRTAVVTTENWVASAFPPPGVDNAYGSRGWGAIVECPDLARALEAVFSNDVRLCAEPWDPAGREPLALPPVPSPAAPLPAASPAVATLLVGPEGWGADLSGPLDLIGSARSSLDVELADLETDWDGTPSPFVSSLVAASGHGARVRVLVEDGPDGSGSVAVERLLAMASEAGATDLRAAVARGLEGADRLHAKVAIVDGQRVLMGSMNWVHASVSRNREVDVGLDCPGASERMAREFEADWCASIAAAPSTAPASLLEALLEGWTPGDGALPPPPEGAAKLTARGIDRAPIMRGALVVGVGLAAWGIERRWRPIGSIGKWILKAGTALGAHSRARSRPVNPAAGEAPPPTPPRPQAPGPPPGQSPQGPPEWLAGAGW